MPEGPVPLSGDERGVEKRWEPLAFCVLLPTTICSLRDKRSPMPPFIFFFFFFKYPLFVSLSASVHFFFLSIYLFIYFWLCWVFVSVRGLSL